MKFPRRSLRYLSRYHTDLSMLVLDCCVECEYRWLPAVRMRQAMRMCHDLCPLFCCCGWYWMFVGFVVQSVGSPMVQLGLLLLACRRLHKSLLRLAAGLVVPAGDKVGSSWVSTSWAIVSLMSSSLIPPSKPPSSSSIDAWVSPSSELGGDG